MNVLFLSLINTDTFEKKHIYTDMLREFIHNGHNVYCVSPVEKRYNTETCLIKEGSSCILRLKVGNMQKTKNLIKKGLSTLEIEPKFIAGIKRYFVDIKFDMILYATPPITFAKVISYVKKRDGAKTYLMLKDIFPQNSVDLGMLSKTGIGGLIHKYFRRKEKVLYEISDKIGCMSQANVDYLLKHNPEIPFEKVEICPNCIEPMDLRLDEEERKEVRQKYGLPLDKKIFVYGGNLGRPQDVPFIVKCLNACVGIENIYFLIAGSGTDRHFLEEYVETEKPKHVRLLDHLPKSEYDSMIACCDVGLIFLDHRFTIPNFPSRLLSYMQAGVPVLACTDTNTDVGKVIVGGGFGWWCESDNEVQFTNIVKTVKKLSLADYGDEAFAFLLQNYNVKHSYDVIMEKIKDVE